MHLSALSQTFSTDYLSTLNWKKYFVVYFGFSIDLTLVHPVISLTTVQYGQVPVRGGQYRTVNLGTNIKYICVYLLGLSRYFARTEYWTDGKLIPPSGKFCERGRCLNHRMLYKKYVMALLQDNIFTAAGVRKYLPNKKIFTWTTPILESELKARWPTDKTLTSLDLIQETCHEKTFIQLLFETFMSSSDPVYWVVAPAPHRRNSLPELRLIYWHNWYIKSNQQCS